VPEGETQVDRLAHSALKAEDFGAKFEALQVPFAPPPGPSSPGQLRQPQIEVFESVKRLEGFRDRMDCYGSLLCGEIAGKA